MFTARFWVLLTVLSAACDGLAACGGKGSEEPAPSEDVIRLPLHTVNLGTSAVDRIH